MSGQPAGALRDVSAKAEAKKLSKDELFRSRVQTETTEIVGLGGEITLRSLTRAQVEEIQVKSSFNSPEFNLFLYETWSILLSVVDPQLTEEDIPAIQNLDNSVFQELSMKIQVLNMMGRVEEAKKVSEETTN